MRIHINGQPRDCSTGTTLLQLLEQSNYGLRRVAVEINLEIIPRSLYTQRILQEGEHIEIVQAVGGG